MHGERDRSHRSIRFSKNIMKNACSETRFILYLEHVRREERGWRYDLDVGVCRSIRRDGLVFLLDRGRKIKEA